MSTETPLPPTANHNGKNLTLDQTPDGDTAYNDGTGRFFVPLDRSKAMAAKAAEAARAAALAEVKPVDESTLRAKWEQEHLAPIRQQLRATEARFAITTAGLIDDDESRAEILDRYDRAPVGADGKKAALPDWIKAQKEGGARWIKAHLPDGTATAAPVATATPATTTPAQPAAPRSNPNGGTVPQVPAATSRTALDNYASLPLAERLKLHEQAMAEAVARGEIAAPTKRT